MSLPISVIVASHGRPALLRRALIGISQCFYRPFEIVVVADAAGLASIADLPFADRLKTAEQSRPNISTARNLGAKLAGGEVLAFIDDDAVPEPTWLDEIARTFTAPDTSAMSGLVLGRNGISEQWGWRSVDRFGSAQPYRLNIPDEDQATKLEGTNMAVRRSVLVTLGGFDEGFSFYLDETDLAWRLHQAGFQTGYNPLAVVHHGYAPSLRRQENRVPRDLTEIGRSSAIYLRKHAENANLDTESSRILSEQSQRLQRFVHRNLLDMAGMERLLESLQQGFAEGRDVAISGPVELGSGQAFQALHDALPKPPQWLAGRWLQRKSLMQKAEALAAEGVSTSLYLFEPTVRAHRVQFSETGVWVQSGGLFGPSYRDQPRFRYWRFADRVTAERERIAEQRLPTR